MSRSTTGLKSSSTVVTDGRFHGMNHLFYFIFLDGMVQCSHQACTFFRANILLVSDLLMYVQYYAKYIAKNRSYTTTINM